MRKPYVLGVLFLVYTLCQSAGLFDGASVSRANVSPNKNATRLQATEDRSAKRMGLTSRGTFYSLIVVGGSIAAWIGLAFVRASDRHAVKQMSRAEVDESLANEVSRYWNISHLNLRFKDSVRPTGSAA
jgi:hypothetical protein